MIEVLHWKRKSNVSFKGKRCAGGRSSSWIHRCHFWIQEHTCILQFWRPASERLWMPSPLLLMSLNLPRLCPFCLENARCCVRRTCHAASLQPQPFVLGVCRWMAFSIIHHGCDSRLMIYNSERCSSDDVAVAVVIMWAYSRDSNAAWVFFKGEAKGLNPLLFPICLPPQSCFESQINGKKKKRLIHLLWKYHPWCETAHWFRCWTGYHKNQALQRQNWAEMQRKVWLSDLLPWQVNIVISEAEQTCLLCRCSLIDFCSFSIGSYL